MCTVKDNTVMKVRSNKVLLCLHSSSSLRGNNEKYVLYAAIIEKVSQNSDYDWDVLDMSGCSDKSDVKNQSVLFD